ncbi:MAG: cellulase family glycosylhydrolase [Chlamydiia bacterium]
MFCSILSACSLFFCSITTRGAHLKDEEGRTLILRGVNVSGRAKYPVPGTDSYVNRPFSLEDARKHLGRIKNLGFNHIRFLTTWDAIEGAAPHQYDEDYLDYVEKFCALAEELELYVVIDMHQDLFSRHLYGSGAPKWAVEAVGLDLAKLVAADALIDPESLIASNPEYLHLIWFFNYNRIACQTLFTLFFGGNTFAPSATYEGKPIQDFLQDQYIGALATLMERLKGNPFVIGCNTMNEPHQGFIGTHLLNRSDNPLGASPNYGDSLSMGAGLATSVEVFERSMLQLKSVGIQVLNPQKLAIFKDGSPFEKEGVYTIENGEFILLKPEYFLYTDHQLDFQKDFYLPFVSKLKRALHKVNPEALLFIEGIVGENLPILPEELTDRTIVSFHWYEGLAFYLKRYLSNLSYSHLEKKVLWGRSGYIKEAMKKELSTFSTHTIPSILSETGFSRDIPKEERKKCFERLFSIIDELQLSAALWHFSPEGDAWNFENFSIYKEGEENDLSPFMRPFAAKVPGKIELFHYNPSTKKLSLKMHWNPWQRAPLEIRFPLELTVMNPPPHSQVEPGRISIYNEFYSTVYLEIDFFQNTH